MLEEILPGSPDGNQYIQNIQKIILYISEAKEIKFESESLFSYQQTIPETLITVSSYTVYHKTTVPKLSPLEFIDEIIGNLQFSQI